MKKRILIPYASYGSGHKMIAKYINDYLEANGDYECMTIDLLTYSIPIIGNLSRKSSNSLMANFPGLWSLIYYMFDNKLSAYIGNNIGLKMFKSKKLIELVSSFNPEITISTHFLGSDLICKYNKKGITNTKLVTIVTDYRAHDFWLNQVKNTDAIIVSNINERFKLLRKGFKNKQIYTTGIPINPDIVDTNNKKDIMVKYKIKPNKKTILFFVGGSDGSSYNLIYFKELLKNNYNANILFVSGKNKTAYKKANEYVKRYNNKNTKVFGFVNNINELYEISDFVVTKPGGAQITECLLYVKPMILIKGNGGQELDNRRFLIKNNYALSSYTKNSFNKNIEKLLYNDKLLEEMKNNISKIEQKKSMEKLFKIIEKL